MSGILNQIKEIEEPYTQPLTVEWLYEVTDWEYWPMLDRLLEDRPDLHDRIEKFKEEWKTY